MAKQLRYFLLLTVFLPGILSGCIQTLEKRGQMLDDEKIQHLHVGMTQDEVVSLLGHPSLRAPFDEDTWHYMGFEQTRVTFLTPKTKDSLILALVFNPENKTLSTIHPYAPQAHEPLAISRRITPELEDKRPILKRFFSTFGRFARKYDSKNKTTQ